jgi:hypothetical protein
MGHCFGLYHIFQLDTTNVKNTYVNGDLVCETPYADFFTEYMNKGYLGRVDDDCKYVGPLGNLTQEEHDENIANIMGYSTHDCRTKFNKDQAARMYFIINNSENHKRMFSEILEK